MGYDYTDRVAIVTGASSGIGRAIALDLARRRAVVIAVARRADMLGDVIAICRRSSPDSDGVAADVSDREAIEEAVGRVLERFGKIDIVVNNAGIPMRVHATRLTVEDVRKAMEVNFMGSVYVTMAALPSMLRRRRGHIVNVASVAGRVASPREAAYAASKFAMAGWSETLASDLYRTGVRVHSVYPGPIRTEIWDKITEPAAYHGKMYPPEDVAAAVRACIEKGYFERYVPGHFAVMPIVRALMPRLFLAAGARFDRKHAGR